MKILNRLTEIINPAHVFWSGDLNNFAGIKKRLIFFARVLRLVGRGFRSDRCALHASALTYYTLMSLVPLLALGLSLARIFGCDDIAKGKVAQMISEFGAGFAANAANPSGKEMSGEFIAHLNGYAERIFDQIGSISFGTLGGVGLITLILMSVTMLSKIEGSFNNVWHAAPRGIWRKFADYVAIIIVVPFLIAAASTIPVVSAITDFTSGGTGIFAGTWFSGILRFAAESLLTVSVFTVILVFVPNAKVKFRAGVMGAVFTALLFFIWLKACTALQFGVVKYSRLYGGLAALPILLAWTYMSWEILFFGAELTFAIQHSESFFRDEGAATAPSRVKWKLAFAIAANLAEKLEGDGGPFDVRAFASKERISIRLAIDTADLLSNAGIAAKTADGQYVLALTPGKITLNDIFSAVVDSGTKPEALGFSEKGPAAKSKEDQYDSAFAESLKTTLAEYVKKSE